MSIIYIAK